MVRLTSVAVGAIILAETLLLPSGAWAERPGWSQILPVKGMEGVEADEYWRREGDGVVGARKDNSAVLKFGEEGWKDFELAFEATVHEGGNLDVGFRSSGKQAYVFKFFLGRQTCAIMLRDLTGKEPLRDLGSVAHKLEHGRKYAVRIVAKGGTLTSFVDGNEVNRVVDATLSAGKAYLEVWQGRVTVWNIRYRKLEVTGRPVNNSRR